MGLSVSVLYSLTISTHWKNGKRQCQTCAQYFDSTKDLRLHIRAEHKAEGAYPCPHCLKSFSLEEFLKRHVSKNHSEKTSLYLCKHCGMEFKDRSQLRFGHYFVIFGNQYLTARRLCARKDKKPTC